MSVRWRVGTRFSAALVITAIPVVTAGFGPAFTPTAQTTPVVGSVGGSVVGSTPSSAPSAQVSLAPLAPSVTAMQRHYVSRLPADQRPQVVAPVTTIEAGLSLRTKAERNRKIAVSSSKGGHVFTASSLAEHDLPSAAMRAYKNAAREIESSDPGCHLPWTLLAGIGRVESDHGRYGGSVLSSDGVPRPAIVGVALNGKGPVAAIRDTDNGRFDGDKVWDRAVGPMQFIPSTWRSAGRDGDHDGVANPNDIDDASLAAAAYLCSGGRDLDYDAAQKSAVFSYNASDYYVALVMAFAQGYRTGVFVIPSPPAAPGSGDGVVHLKAHKHKAHKVHHKARVRSTQATRHVTPVRPPAHRAPVRHQPAPTPSAPKPPSYTTVTGALDGSAGGPWTVGGKTFSVSGAGTVGVADFDGDGHTESLADELDGVVARAGKVTIRFEVGSSPLKVVALSVNSMDPVPASQPAASQAAAPAAPAS